MLTALNSKKPVAKLPKAVTAVGKLAAKLFTPVFKLSKSSEKTNFNLLAVSNPIRFAIDNGVCIALMAFPTPPREVVNFCKGLYKAPIPEAVAPIASAPFATPFIPFAIEVRFLADIIIENTFKNSDVFEAAKAPNLKPAIANAILSSTFAISLVELLSIHFAIASRNPIKALLLTNLATSSAILSIASPNPVNTFSTLSAVISLVISVILSRNL